MNAISYKFDLDLTYVEKDKLSKKEIIPVTVDKDNIYPYTIKFALIESQLYYNWDNDDKFWHPCTNFKHWGDGQEYPKNTDKDGIVCLCGSAIFNIITGNGSYCTDSKCVFCGEVDTVHSG